MFRKTNLTLGYSYENISLHIKESRDVSGFVSI